MPKSYRRREATIPFKAGGQASEELRLSGLVRSLQLVLSGDLTFAGASAHTWKFGNVLNLVRNLTLRLEQKLILKSGSLLDFWTRQAMLRKIPRQKNLTTAAGVDYDDFRIIVPLNFIRPFSATPLDTLLDMNRFDRLDLEIQWGNYADCAIDNGANAAIDGADLQLEVYSDVVGSDLAPRAFYQQNGYNLPTLVGNAEQAAQEYRLVTAPNTSIASLWATLFQSDATYGEIPVDPIMLEDIQIRETIGGQIDINWEYANGQDALRQYGEQIAWSSDWLVGYSGSGAHAAPNNDNREVCPVPIVYGGMYEGRSDFDLPTGQANDLRMVYTKKTLGQSNSSYIRLLEDRINYAYAVL